MSEIIRILQFILIGIWNTAFDLALFWLFINTLGKLKLWSNIKIKPAVISHILSFLGASAVSYFLNARFTFGDASKNRGWGLYLAVSLFSLIISTILISFFTQDRFYQWFTRVFVSKIPLLEKIKFDTKKFALLVKLGTVAVTLVTNYLGYKYFVFR